MVDWREIKIKGEQFIKWISKSIIWFLVSLKNYTIQFFTLFGDVIISIFKKAKTYLTALLKLVIVANERVKEAGEYLRAWLALFTLILFPITIWLLWGDIQNYRTSLIRPELELYIRYDKSQNRFEFSLRNDEEVQADRVIFSLKRNSLTANEDRYIVSKLTSNSKSSDFLMAKNSLELKLYATNNIEYGVFLAGCYNCKKNFLSFLFKQR